MLVRGDMLTKDMQSSKCIERAIENKTGFLKPPL
jgi:hypothetical protein